MDAVNLRRAIRSLFKSPLLTLVVTASLALGIGADVKRLDRVGDS